MVVAIALARAAWNRRNRPGARALAAVGGLLALGSTVFVIVFAYPARYQELWIVTSYNVSGVLTIEDEGPGIPEREYAVLGSAEQSQLRHGRGLGIWMVRWIVTRLGGTLSFDADSAGTIVTVHLPRVEDEKRRDARSNGVPTQSR